MSKSSSVTKDLIDKLSNLTVLEMSNLVKELEETWGVSAAAPVAIAAAGDATPAAEAAEQATEFDVILKGAVDPSNQIPLIKELKNLCGLSLRDSKEAVEEVCAGKARTVKSKIEKSEATELETKLKAAGAILEVVASS